MKKKLEAELLSLAHRVLKLTGKEDVAKMHEEAKKLSELLGILRFYEERILGKEPQPTAVEVEAALTQMLSEPTHVTAPEPIHVGENLQASSEIVEEQTEVTEEEVAAETEIEVNAETEEEVAPLEEVAEVEASVVTTAEEMLEDETPVLEEQQPVAELPKAPSLEDFLRESYAAPEFVKVETPKEEPQTGDLFSSDVPKVEEPILEAPLVEETPIAVTEEVQQPEINEIKVEETHFTEVKEEVEVTTIPEPIETIAVQTPVVEEIKSEVSTPTPTQVTYTRTESTIQKTTTTVSLNDRLTKGLQIGLNDRIAFVKHLFNGSNEDYNRVLSQLNSFNSMDEAVSFIDQVVKPDYNDWADKEDYAQRFMALVERKFIA